MISKHFDKNNLHHAYLIEGEREEVLAEVIKFMDGAGFRVDNPDFLNIKVDSFKIEDARNLKSLASERPVSLSAKKIFLLSANEILLEAQHSMLKMFEEPIENTHFFITVPDASSLLNTLVSRFYFIPSRQNLKDEEENALKFIKMPLQKRIDFLKELLAEAEEGDEEGREVVALNSARSKALKFLNALELMMSKAGFGKNMSGAPLDMFEHFFKVRKFLRMPGSSAKMLMESVALIVPNL